MITILSILKIFYYETLILFEPRPKPNKYFSHIVEEDLSSKIYYIELSFYNNFKNILKNDNLRNKYFDAISTSHEKILVQSPSKIFTEVCEDLQTKYLIQENYLVYSLDRKFVFYCIIAKYYSHNNSKYKDNKELVTDSLKIVITVTGNYIEKKSGTLKHVSIISQEFPFIFFFSSTEYSNAKLCKFILDLEMIIFEKEHVLGIEKWNNMEVLFT